MNYKYQMQSSQKKQNETNKNDKQDDDLLDLMFQLIEEKDRKIAHQVFTNEDKKSQGKDQKASKEMETDNQQVQIQKVLSQNIAQFQQQKVPNLFSQKQNANTNHFQQKQSKTTDFDQQYFEQAQWNIINLQILKKEFEKQMSIMFKFRNSSSAQRGNQQELIKNILKIQLKNNPDFQVKNEKQKEKPKNKNKVMLKINSQPIRQVQLKILNSQSSNIFKIIRNDELSSQKKMADFFQFVNQNLFSKLISLEVSNQMIYQQYRFNKIFNERQNTVSENTIKNIDKFQKLIQRIQKTEYQQNINQQIEQKSGQNYVKQSMTKNCVKSFCFRIKQLFKEDANMQLKLGQTKSYLLSDQIIKQIELKYLSFSDNIQKVLGKNTFNLCNNQYYSFQSQQVRMLNLCNCHQQKQIYNSQRTLNQFQMILSKYLINHQENNLFFGQEQDKQLDKKFIPCTYPFYLQKDYLQKIKQYLNSLDEMFQQQKIRKVCSKVQGRMIYEIQDKINHFLCEDQTLIKIVLHKIGIRNKKLRYPVKNKNVFVDQYQRNHLIKQNQYIQKNSNQSAKSLRVPNQHPKIQVVKKIKIAPLSDTFSNTPSIHILNNNAQYYKNKNSNQGYINIEDQRFRTSSKMKRKFESQRHLSNPMLAKKIQFQKYCERVGVDDFFYANSISNSRVQQNSQQQERKMVNKSSKGHIRYTKFPIQINKVHFNSKLFDQSTIVYHINNISVKDIQLQFMKDRRRYSINKVKLIVQNDGFQKSLNYNSFKIMKVIQILNCLGAIVKLEVQKPYVILNKIDDAFQFQFLSFLLAENLQKVYSFFNKI